MTMHMFAHYAVSGLAGGVMGWNFRERKWVTITFGFAILIANIVQGVV